MPEDATNCALAQRLFAENTPTPEELEAQFPPRNLPEGAAVTRFAPSPTGYLHFGGLYAALTNRLTANQTKGIFLLRIEDTDKKREVADGISAIVEGLAAFGVAIDEGVVGFGKEQGSYGPYIQSERKAIYHAFARRLVEQGLAYPCFCSAEELK